MKKILCLILAMILIIPTGITVFAADLAWPYVLDTAMPFKPADHYVSQNNPPSFSWPLVSNTAYYDLKICTDKEMKNVAFEKTGIANNVYNFNVQFDVETKYYWSVRYKEGVNYSVWTEPREFIIDTDSSDFRMPEFTPEYIDEAIIKTHPRLLLNDSKLAKLRSLKGNNSSYIMQKLTSAASNAMSREIPSVEELKAMWDAGLYGTNGTNYHVYARDLANVALMYVITQDKKYLDFVESVFINHMQYWVPKKLWKFDSLTDTTEPYFINAVAYVYDWLYNDMSDKARAAGKTTIENHIENWYEYYGGGSIRANMNSLYAKPDASHQWRGRQISLGALAIYDESSLARNIILNILPIYAHALPMTKDDGSFDNNPFYYTSSGTMDFEFSESLYTASAGKIDVRNNVAFQNRDYYLTYQWPVGGFVSILGDQNRQKSISANTYNPSIQGIVSSDAYNDIQRGVNAWMMKKNGQDKDDYYHSDHIATVLWNDNADVEYITPTMLENSKLFKDSGIASLFSDVADDNKIAISSSKKNLFL